MMKTSRIVSTLAVAAAAAYFSPLPNDPMTIGIIGLVIYGGNMAVDMVEPTVASYLG